jgi:hypothetical protein
MCKNVRIKNKEGKVFNEKAIIFVDWITCQPRFGRGCARFL